MNILILGSGGREHAFAKKITESSLCKQLFIAPGNAGTSNIGTNVSISVEDFDKIKDFCINNTIQMVVVGPEDLLVKGIYDFFQNDNQLQHIPIIGPSKLGATLEGSKEFAKEFMTRHNIPTAHYQSFTKETIEQGKAFLATMQPPYVLKANGLAQGKGVLIINNLQQAQDELEQMLINAKFGNASTKVVVEEFLSGIELSCFVLTDGKNYKILPTAKDYKRIGEADTGLNTGGMGAISPVPFADEDFLQKIETRIVQPTIKGLQQDKINYKGFIFIGLIKVGNDPYVIEYNVRMGDPETEVVLPRIQSDLVELLKATSEGKLANFELKITPQTAVTVVLVSGGYPENYQKGFLISGLETIEESIVFHAGTSQKNEQIVTSGGRVLAITSLDNNLVQALEKSYKNISKITFEKMYFRKDIGFEFI